MRKDGKDKGIDRVRAHGGLQITARARVWLTRHFTVIPYGLARTAKKEDRTMLNDT